MEFGRVPEAELSTIKFKLPKDPVFNNEILKGKPAKASRVYLGCAKWGRKEWVGKIYPLKTREKNFLQHYVEHYNSIELNAAHYKIYGAIARKEWAVKAGKRDFLFCPKMYQGVTHRGKLGEKQFILNEYLRGLSGFGEHLGPIFVQVDERFTPKRKEELYAFLEKLPKGYQFFLEVRHPAWFVKDMEIELFEKLHSLGIGAVITDTAGGRDCAHMYLSIPKVFIRFVGNSLHPSDYKRCDDWVNRIDGWLKKGMEEVYFFMHMHDEATSPELTVYLVDQLNKKCKLSLPRPKFI